MKNLLRATACAVVMISCYSCSVESAETTQEESLTTQEDLASFVAPEVQCSSQDPQAVLTNNSLLPVDFEVLDQFGLLITHAYGVAAGDVSSVLTFPDGVTTFIVSTEIFSKEIKIDMENCMIYEVEIDVNNQLNTDDPIQL
ncbi:hypothetical protein [Psychroserpens ponticola]|uniref:Uncharacterized protein n=1 Tax=Psychroserpens ponticola TaxID=2932268 RepID=A0ABY7RVU8_9FLAO|nr:hypothetical protein [Psychroserpens ponticola]WCO00376.1 hypothetical protein MUN68_009855 [Psychroserpens ponticola]